MTPSEFEQLILNNDIDGLVAAVHGMPEDERQSLAAVASGWFLPYQRFAHLCCDPDLQERHEDEYQHLWQRFMQSRKPVGRETLHVAFTAVAPEAEMRESLKFHFRPLQQHFFVSHRQIELVLERRLGCLKGFYSNAKHVASLGDDFIIPFIRGGLIEKAIVPDERYLICLMAMLHAPSELATRRRSEVILDTPEVIEELWSAFDYEHFGSALCAEPDEYTREQRPRFDRWADTFQQLMASGHIDRRRLLARVRTSITRDDFSSTGQNHFIRLHDQLQPTLDEFAQQAADYFALLVSRSGTVVKFALSVAAQLEKAHRLDGEAFYGAAGAVFQHKPKGHSKQVLSLSEKLAQRTPELVPEAINLAVDAVVHESPEVQEQAVKQLEKWQSRLHPDHASVLGERLDAIAPSIRARVETLIASCSREASPDVGRPSTPTSADAATDGTGKTALLNWLDELQPRVEALPDRWRRLAGVEEAIQVAREGRLPEPPTFRLWEVPVLTSCEPIRAIETIDELFDAVAHAVEVVESAEELERILDGISRLADQRPPDFERRAAPLLKRLPLAGCNVWSWRGSWPGLSRMGTLPALVRLVASWLSGREEPVACEMIVAQMNQEEVSRLNEILSRVLERRSAPLLSAPTHRYGWIAPERFVERVLQWQDRGEAVPPYDLSAALLRLAPDGRSAALAKAATMEGTPGRIVRWALGSDAGPKADDERQMAIWLAAGRARVPEGPILELQGCPALSGLPFGAGSTDLIWKIVPPFGDPTPRDQDEYVGGNSDAPIVAYWEPKCPKDWPGGLLTVALAGLVHPRGGRSSSPVWDRQWLAFRWPLNTDPYLAAGLTAIRSRVNSMPSTLDPNFAFLEPLLQADRPWSEMACIVLALSLVSRDADTRGTALDVLITSIEDGRASIPLLSQTWRRMCDWQGLKLKRIADALTEAGRVSPLHTWFAANVAQHLLASLPDWPADGHHLLARLVEWLAELQLPISDDLRAKLTTTKLIGKSVKLSTTLLKLVGASSQGPTSLLALQMAAECRIARAERWSSDAS